jgi:hypothetical protein
MEKVIYTGENDPARGLFKHYIYEELPPHLVELVKTNPAIAAQFAPWDSFWRRRPPGARVRPRLNPPIVVPAQPPIRRK